MWFIRFKQVLAILFMPWLLALFIQSAGRLFLFYSYVDKTKLTAYHDNIVTLFTVGLRFDVRIATIAFGSLLLLSLVTLFSQKLTLLWQKIISYIAGLFLLIISIFIVINIFYYITYDRHIDVFIFGIIDDDTVAVLKTIWADYPVVWGLIGLMILATLIFKLVAMWQRFVAKRFCRRLPIGLSVPMVLIVFVFVAIGCRGSIGTFPLRESNAQISSYSVLNKFVPNGVMAMVWAYNAYQLDSQFINLSPKVRQQAMINFFGEQKPNSVDIFLSKTDANPVAKAKRPNVVFSVMESMGSHLFQFDKPNRDLLGSLRSHWQNDWLFSRFVSEGDGTIDSLSRFFVRSPMDKVSQSFAQKTDFLSNMFKPFKDNGYKIIYITPGNGAWRNLNQFLPNLGVDEFIEQNTLKHEYPKAEIGTWGVPDEYMFKYAEKRLAQAEQQGEHVMIMMMSVTNHPPYHSPDNQPFYNYQFTQEEIKRFANMDDETELRNMFNTFRYSNEQLGDFISWIKAQPLGEYTILAVTGDHNLRGIGYPNPTEAALSHSVPFYLYVPKTYQYNSVYDRSRVGSHKDIVPTLYHLTLPNTVYYKTGCNLLAKDLDNQWCNVGYNPFVTIDKNGAYSLVDNTFLPWQNTTGLALQDNKTNLSVEEQKALLKWQSWTQLLHWQLVEQIQPSQQ